MSISIPTGGIVIGVGIDLVDIERIRAAAERHEERFLDRVYTEEERTYCFNFKNPYPSLAVRFAAKEAIAKAFSTGICGDFEWKSASIYKGGRDEPLVRLDELGRLLLKKMNGTDVLVSLSHTGTQATAIALIVKSLAAQKTD